MKELSFYRVITYILVPFASILGIMDLFMIPSALGNPSILFSVFLLATFCIYVFASLIFLVRHIDQNKHAKHSLKDWVKVNAYASFFLGIQFLVSAVGIFYMPQHELSDYIDKFLGTQANMPSNINTALFIKIMRGVAYFLFFFSFLLIVHVTMGLRLLKKYAYLFNDEPTSTEE
ncbi:MAG: hypothetical protein WCH78_04855 [Bacteroidota bacterium]